MAEVATKEAAIISLLGTIMDPEIPVLSVVDMGIVHDIQISDSGVSVVIIPTYSGCPAMNMIAVQIQAALEAAGYRDVDVRMANEPAWTTDRITHAGREALLHYGIAPPKEPDSTPNCPQCGSADTRLLSQFGSTACKSLWQCNSCMEPFDYFKCHR